MRSYLDSHSNGEINKKMDDIQQFADTKKTTQRKISDYRKIQHIKSLAIRLLTFAERSFLTLADGAKYSLSSRGKSRLQISTLRSRVELTDSNCLRREVKANCRYPHYAHGWISAVGFCRQLESWQLGVGETVFSSISERKE
ncbi:hypothetical protein TNCV_3431141 [Trichonephila clavipes]|nr:hypothetical protein TNCV_3431141 [Trichonephila clavipes]